MHRILVAGAIAAAVAVSSSSASAQELAVQLGEGGPGARVGWDLGAGFVLDAGFDSTLLWGSGAESAHARAIAVPVELRHRFGDRAVGRVVPTLGLAAIYGSMLLEQAGADFEARSGTLRVAIGAEHWATESFAVYADGGYAVTRIWSTSALGATAQWISAPAWRLGVRFRL